MAEPYFEVVWLVERAHRRLLEIIQIELDNLGIQDLRNVQAMVLYNIGDTNMTVGQFTLRGCYLGSSLSYNVRKLVRNGYLEQDRSAQDRRFIHLKLTDKGRALRNHLSAMHQRHIEMLKETAETQVDLEAAALTLRDLERFWMSMSDAASVSPQFAA